MPISVLIADDQSSMLNQLRGYWEKALGPGPRYEMAQDIDNVERKLKLRPHVVILDNQFTAASTNDGATFIAKVKEKHPDSVFVLMTGKGFDIEQLGQRTPNPDFIVPKPYLLNDGYLKYIGDAIRAFLKRAPALVSVPTQGLDEIGVTAEAFSSLVEQCLASLEVLEFDLASEPKAAFSVLSGGFSGAAVYQMEVRGAGRTPSLPLVLKCGSREQIGREIRAFERWVRWQLPHDMRVDVIGRGVTGDHAAVCYGFVLGSSTKLTSLADAIRAKDFEAVEASLKRIFFAERSGWYKARRENANTLCKYLLNSPEFAPTKDEKRTRQLKAALTQLVMDEGISLAETAFELVVDGKPYPSVRSAIASVDGGPADLAYCHGDLNANNIFLDDKYNGLALIDFEQSGESHIFRDFISIETSIRMDLPEDMTKAIAFRDLVAAERRYCESDPAAADGSYEGWIGLIRKLARDRFPTAPALQHRVPLVLHAWKVLGVKEWPQETRRRLTAAVLGGLQYLASAKS